MESPECCIFPYILWIDLSFNSNVQLKQKRHENQPILHKQKDLLVSKLNIFSKDIEATKNMYCQTPTGTVQFDWRQTEFLGNFSIRYRTCL